MKYAVLIFSLCFCLSGYTQSNEADDKLAILKVMKQQEIAWSNHDLEGFMQGYWKSDSLKFYGSRGLTRGWQQTLENYKKGYPTKEESGTLSWLRTLPLRWQNVADSKFLVSLAGLALAWVIASLALLLAGSVAIDVEVLAPWLLGFSVLCCHVFSITIQISEF